MRAFGAVLLCAFSVAVQADPCVFGFSNSGLYSVNNYPGDLVIADFNGDTYPDAAVANSNGQTITLLAGAAGGTFMTPGTTLAVGFPADLATGDVDGDGKLDIIASTSWNDSVFKGHLQVFTGNGDGTFNKVAYTEDQLIFQNPSRIAAGDIDGDGKTDAVVTVSSGVSSVLSNGSYMVEKAQYRLSPPLQGDTISGIVLVDLDLDGRLDIMAAARNQNLLIPLWGNGDGTFVEGTHITMTPPTGSAGMWGMTSGDFNGDGVSDVVVGWRQDNGGSTPVQMVLNNGDRTFALQNTTGSVDIPSELIATDLNGDGKLDLVAGAVLMSAYMLGNGDGTLQTQQYLGMSGAGIALADLDANGSPDILGTYTNGGTMTVAKAACGIVTLNLTSSANPSLQGDSVTITGNLTSPAAFSASGTLTLTRDATTVDTQPVNGTATATNTDNTLALGTYPFTLSYSGDAHYLATTRTLTQTVQSTPPDVPVSLNATGSAGGPVSLTWAAAPGADHYEVWRNAGSGWRLAGTPSTTNFTDTVVPAEWEIAYKVRAVSAGGAISAFGPLDLASTWSYFFPIVPRSTPVMGGHVYDLRRVANITRRVAGLTTVNWGDPVLTVIKASHWTEIRNAIGGARTALGMAPANYSETPAVGMVIKAAHAIETRAAVQ